MFYYFITFLLLTYASHTHTFEQKKLGNFTWALPHEKRDVSNRRYGTAETPCDDSLILEAEKHSILDARHVFINNARPTSILPKSNWQTRYLTLSGSHKSNILFLSAHAITNYFNAIAENSSINADNAIIEAEGISLIAAGENARISAREASFHTINDRQINCSIQVKENGFINLESADFRSFTGTIALTYDETSTENIILDNALFATPVKGLPAHYELKMTPAGHYQIQRKEQ